MKKKTILTIALNILLVAAVNATPVYLILYVPQTDMLAQVNRLKVIKESEGFQVLTSSSSCVYNQYPALDPKDAIKEYLLSIYDNPAYDLEFVLLVSSQRTDYPRYWINLPGGGIAGSYLSDDWYVDFEGDDLLPEVAIGRLPFAHSEELYNYVDKLLAYDVHRGEGWCDDVIISIDNVSHFSVVPAPGMTWEQYFQMLYDTSDTFSSFIEPHCTVEELRRAQHPTPYAAYRAYIDSGAALSVHLGSGSKDGIGGFWNELNYAFLTAEYGELNSVEALANNDKYPFFYYPVCYGGNLHGVFLRYPDTPTLAERLNFVEEKGAIGVLAPVGWALLTRDLRLFTRFFITEILDYGTPVGEALKEAKKLYFNQKQSNPAYVLSMELYCDPSLKLCLPCRDYFPPVVSGFPILLDESIWGLSVANMYPSINQGAPVEHPPYIIGSGDSLDIAFLTSDVAKGYDHAGKCNFSVPAAQLGSSVPLVDIDSDGLFESVVCGDDGVFIYDNEGNMLDGFPVFFVNPVAEAPAVGDVNGDGYLDVVVLTDSKVHVIDHTGAELSGWPANLPTDFSPVGAPAVGDLDNDGFLEIVVGTRSFSPSNSNVCVYDKNGNAKAGFPYTLYNQAITPPALADLTDDGPVEIVVASTLYSGGTWDNAEYYVFDSAGNKTVDVALNGYSIYKTPAVGDFVTWPEWPGKEVVLIGYDSPSFYILARTATTGAYRNTISMGNEIPTSALTIGDVNFLDTNEVVIGCEDRLMAYDLACGLVPFGGDWDGTLNGAVSTPIVTDLNGNTHCDIICGDGEALYAFTTHAIFNTIGTYDWIREGHDNMNTGIWDILAPTGVVAEDVPDDQGHKITLAWTPSVDDGVRSTRVTGYKIYREAGEVGPPPGGDGLAGGTASAAALAAKRSEGRLADVAGPASPTDSAGGTDLEQDNYLLIDTVAAGTFYYEDDNLDNLREYHYYIVATDGVHNSQPSVNVYVVPRDNIAPAAPTNLACNIVDDGGDPVHVVLSWTRSVDDPLYSEGLPGDTSPDGVVARPFNRPDGTAARPVPGGVASGAGGADTAALLAAGDSAGRNGASAPVAGGTAAFPLSDKEGDAAKAKVDERVFNPGAPGIPNKSRRLWAGGDLDGGANDVENYQIMKNAATIDYYPDTQGNDVEYVDWNVSYGNMYYYSVAARDSENYSPAAGPVTADLTQIPEDYITFPGEADAPTTPGLAARTGVPGASEKINETGFGASGAEKRSKVVTCKPNPVTGTATFTINLKAGGPARLDVYDISGRRIATVLDRAVSAGGDSVTWTPTVAAGIYVYVLEAEGRHYVGKVAVAR